MRPMTIAISGEPSDALAKHLGPDVRLVPWAHLRDAESVWRRAGDSTRALVDVVDRFDSVRWVHCDTVGVDRLPLERWQERGIRISNGRGLSAAHVAEWAVAAALLGLRNLHQSVAATAAHEWAPPRSVARSLQHQRVVVIGLGAIGTRVARLVSAFDAPVVGVVRGEAAPDDPRRAVVQRLMPSPALLDVCAGATVLFVCAPATPASVGMVSAEVLTALAPGAWVINASRGEVIDEAALVEGVRSGRLGGAVLDVVTNEPPPPNSPMWSHPNIVLTGHSADFPRPSEAEAARLIAGELKRYRRGERFDNEVDLRLGY